MILKISTMMNQCHRLLAASQQSGAEPGDESSRKTDLRRIAPCLNRFAKTTGGSWWLKPESNHQNSKEQALDEINKEKI